MQFVKSELIITFQQGRSISGGEKAADFLQDLAPLGKENRNGQRFEYIEALDFRVLTTFSLLYLGSEFLLDRFIHISLSNTRKIMYCTTKRSQFQEKNMVL
jgi:hypothetical protein